MKQYLVSINVVAEKLFLIKLIRAVTLWGLKDSKDYVETNLSYWGDQSRIEFGLTLTAEQLGHLTHYSLQARHIDRMFIDASREVTPHTNAFDLTNA